MPIAVSRLPAFAASSLSIKQIENPGNSPPCYSLGAEVPSLYAFSPPFRIFLYLFYIKHSRFSVVLAGGIGQCIHLLHLPESRSPHFLNGFPLCPNTQIPGKMRVESVEEIFFFNMMLTYLDTFGSFLNQNELYD